MLSENKENFVRKISNLPGISKEQSCEIYDNACKMLRRRADKGEEYDKTFEYVKRFTETVRNNKGENFKANVNEKKLTEKTNLVIIEPPCGSNTFMVCGEKAVLFIDCGFACYKKEMDKLFHCHVESYKEKKKILILTHCDIDHSGIIDYFDEVYMSGISKENFVREKQGKKGYREENKYHQPYRKIAEIITEYTPPKVENIKTFKDSVASIAEKTDEFNFEDIVFSVISGNGGHVQGEIMLVAEKEKIIFTGDVFVNTKSYTKKQREFSDIALYLVPSVNQNSEKATICREYVMKKI